MLWQCGAGMWSAIHAPSVGSKLWMHACGVRLKINKRTVLLYGESATTLSTIAACLSGLSRTIAVHCASRTGSYRESANEVPLTSPSFHCKFGQETGLRNFDLLCTCACACRCHSFDVKI